LLGEILFRFLVLVLSELGPLVWAVRIHEGEEWGSCSLVKMCGERFAGAM
jgi:hypothetical protein